MLQKKQISGAKSLIRGLQGLLEVAVLTGLYYLVWMLAYERYEFPHFFGFGNLLLAGIYATLMAVLLSTFDGFMFGYLKIIDAMLSQGLALLISNFITYWQLCLINNAILSPIPMLQLTLAGMAVVFVCVFFYSWIYHKIYAPKRMAMVLERDTAISLKLKMETRPDKYHIDKIIPVEDGVESICRQIEGFDAVIINDVHAATRNVILKFCYEHEIRTYVTPKLTDIIVRSATSITLFDTPLLLVKGYGLSPAQRFYKRLLDLALCLPALVVAAPIMLLVALAIKLEDGGPVFFRQARATLNDRTFQILKFRSMIVDAEKVAPPHGATDNDPRITKVGRFIRACRLDELPQLLNIIKGDMSIVGPRPERIEHMQAYGKEIPEFVFRTKVKGGLTGYAQIYGKYNTTPYDKLRMDLMYIENYSLALDIKLILITLRILFKRESTEGFGHDAEAQEKAIEELRSQSREEAIPGKK